MGYLMRGRVGCGVECFFENVVFCEFKQIVKLCKMVRKGGVFIKVVQTHTCGENASYIHVK